MSAINDALRRASSASKSTPVTDAQSPPPLPPKPVAPSSPASIALPPLISVASAGLPPISVTDVPPRRRSVLPFLFFFLVLLCVFGAGASYLYARKNGPVLAKFSPLARLETEALETEMEEEEVPENEIRPNSRPVVAAPAPAPVAAAAPVAPAPRTVTPTFAPAPTVPAANVRFPALKLQSIYYRPSNPSVMINGKTLYISDEIHGVTVADIKPSSVTLVLSGHTNVLTLR